MGDAGGELADGGQAGLQGRLRLQGAPFGQGLEGRPLAAHGAVASRWLGGGGEWGAGEAERGAAVGAAVLVLRAHAAARLALGGELRPSLGRDQVRLVDVPAEEALGVAAEQLLTGAVQAGDDGVTVGGDE